MLNFSKVKALWILNATSRNWYWFKWVLSEKRNSRGFFLVIFSSYKPTLFLMYWLGGTHLICRPLRNLSNRFKMVHISFYRTFWSKTDHIDRSFRKSQIEKRKAIMYDWLSKKLLVLPFCGSAKFFK